MEKFYIIFVDSLHFTLMLVEVDGYNCWWMLPHTCNPVNSQTLNASYANSRRENFGVMPSISSGFENTLVCGVGAVLSPVHIARFNVGIHLIMNDI